MIIPLEIDSVSGSCLYDDVGSILIDFYSILKGVEEQKTTKINHFTDQELYVLAEKVAQEVFKQIKK